MMPTIVAQAGPPAYSNIPFGVSPFRNGSMRAMQQVGLRDDGGVRRRGQDGEARGRQRLAHVAHDAAAEQPEQRDRMLERHDVGIAGDDEHRESSAP